MIVVVSIVLKRPGVVEHEQRPWILLSQIRKSYVQENLPFLQRSVKRWTLMSHEHLENELQGRAQVLQLSGHLLELTLEQLGTINAPIQLYLIVHDVFVIIVLCNHQ